MNDRGLNHLSEDATGFGWLELRTARDAVLRPAAMLEAYMTAGPTGDGKYSRPLRFYLALCGILMLQLFLMGGTSVFLSGLPPGAMDPLIEQSGKSRDAFMADLDNWMTLVLVPLNALFYALVSAPLLRWWDEADLGWRKSFRATFHYLNVWTLPYVPVAFLTYMPGTALGMSLIIVVLSIVAFLRTGRGRWYRTTLGGLGKALVITALNYAATFLASFPLLAVGIAGGMWG
ncbi:MAG: hypothetical protein KKF88_00030 [Alphaproteobacteria bacterium]|nr:hypothetical protein [Alphaproteobacteria bacterium]